MKKYCVFILSCWVCMLPAVLTAGEFYVSPSGDDAAVGNRQAPFATLRGAREAVRESANTILQAAAGKIQLEPAEFDRLLGDILWTGWLDLSSGALGSLLQSGKLSLIKNRKLSEHLAALPYWLDNTARVEEFELRHLDTDLFPFFSDRRGNKEAIAAFCELGDKIVMSAWEFSCFRNTLSRN